MGDPTKSIASKAHHEFCPTGDESWCKYHSNRNTYKAKPGFPTAIREFINPLFMKLSDEKLLEKCLYGKTQNIMNYTDKILTLHYGNDVQKDAFVERDVLQTGVPSTTTFFNDGSERLLDVLKELKVMPGHFSEIFVTVRSKLKFQIWKINQLLKQKVEENNYELFEWAL